MSLAQKAGISSYKLFSTQYFFCYKVLNVTFGRDSLSSLDPPSYHRAACYCSKGKRTKTL